MPLFSDNTPTYTLKVCIFSNICICTWMCVYKYTYFFSLYFVFERIIACWLISFKCFHISKYICDCAKGKSWQARCKFHWTLEVMTVGLCITSYTQHLHTHKHTESTSVISYSLTNPKLNWALSGTNWDSPRSQLELHWNCTGQHLDMEFYLR